LISLIKADQSNFEPPMDKKPATVSFSGTQTNSIRRVLNAGSGSYNARKLHPVFAPEAWEEVRIDIDPKSKPDIVASITDMRSACAPQSFDAIWASHILEHLYAHDVPSALAEFRRILKPDGFALITSPDLEAVASLVLEHGLDHVAYTSPAGPITPLDMLFGHSASIARGSLSMAHKTGFSCVSLGQRFVDSGFPVAVVKREGVDLWALGLMQEADQAGIQRQLLAAGLDIFDQTD
jgi:SAM-dependent methyltransferase